MLFENCTVIVNNKAHSSTDDCAYVELVYHIIGSKINYADASVNLHMF